MLAVRVTKLKCPICGWTMAVPRQVQTNATWLDFLYWQHLSASIMRFRQHGAKAL